MKQYGFFDGIRNPFSTNFWRKLDEQASYVYDQYRLLPSIQRAVGYERTDRGDTGGGENRNWRYARITSNTIINGESYRWVYDWVAVTINSTGSDDVPPTAPSRADVSPALSSDGNNLPAINLAEWNNSLTAGAYGQVLDTSEGELVPLPIPVGTVVVLFNSAQPNGQVGYVFEAYNPMTLNCL